MIWHTTFPNRGSLSEGKGSLEAHLWAQLYCQTAISPLDCRQIDSEKIREALLALKGQSMLEMALSKQNSKQWEKLELIKVRNGSAILQNLYGDFCVLVGSATGLYLLEN